MKEARKWDTRKTEYLERMSGAAPYIGNGKVVAAGDTVRVLEAVIRPFDRVNIEGNNQKQADFLAECLKKRDVARSTRTWNFSARYFVDLTPRVSLVCAYEGDSSGNLYTGFNTEDTLAVVEATKFRQGIADSG